MKVRVLLQGAIAAIILGLWVTPAVATRNSTDFSQPKSASRSQSQSLTTDLRGIYDVIVTSSDHSPPDSLSVPGVDGLLLTVGWDEIEPSMGKYQWEGKNSADTLKYWLDLAKQNGLKVDLAINAGRKTPKWLFHDANATELDFKFPNKGQCDMASIAAPWDPVFLTQWDQMLTTVAAHLNDIGDYDTVDILRLTAVNRISGELYLPSSTSENSLPDCRGDAVDAIWQNAPSPGGAPSGGYLPSSLLAGWDAITDSFKAHFPDKAFSVAIIDSTHPFPAIAEDGSPLKGTTEEISTLQNKPLLEMASRKFNGRLIVQNLSLYPGSPAQPETIAFGQSLSAMIAFQTNEDNKGIGATCGKRDGKQTACTDATFLDLLLTGVYPKGPTDPLRAEYIEVFASDTDSFQNAIQTAHDDLFAPFAEPGRGPPVCPVQGKNPGCK